MKAKRMLLALLAMYCTIGYAQNVEQTEVPEQCVATFIHEGLRIDVILWKSFFHLDTARVQYYYEALQQLEDEDDLPRHLVEEAVDQCRALYETMKKVSKT
jgi:hypothetical protein